MKAKFLVAPLLGWLTPAAFGDIYHLCLGGTYVQYSPSQDKAVIMGTCGGRNWAYKELTDVLLMTVPGHDVTETLGRFRNSPSARPIPLAQVQQMAAAVAGRNRPLSRIAAPSAMMRNPRPEPCPEGMYPPCDACLGLPPFLCKTLGGLAGPRMQAAAAVARPGPVAARQSH